MMDQNSERIRLMVNLNGKFSLVTIKDNPNFCFLEILRGRGTLGRELMKFFFSLPLFSHFQMKGFSSHVPSCMPTDKFSKDPWGCGGFEILYS